MHLAAWTESDGASSQHYLIPAVLLWEEESPAPPVSIGVPRMSWATSLLSWGGASGWEGWS